MGSNTGILFGLRSISPSGTLVQQGVACGGRGRFFALFGVLFGLCFGLGLCLLSLGGFQLATEEPLPHVRALTRVLHDERQGDVLVGSHDVLHQSLDDARRLRNGTPM